VMASGARTEAEGHLCGKVTWMQLSSQPCQDSAVRVLRVRRGATRLWSSDGREQGQLEDGAASPYNALP